MVCVLSYICLYAYCIFSCRPCGYGVQETLCQQTDRCGLVGCHYNVVRPASRVIYNTHHIQYTVLIHAWHTHWYWPLIDMNTEWCRIAIVTYVARIMYGTYCQRPHETKMYSRCIYAVFLNDYIISYINIYIWCCSFPRNSNASCIHHTIDAV